jgi:allantoinase
MMNKRNVIRSRRVALPGGVHAASITVHQGVIQEIGPFDCNFDEDAGDSVIMPGLVDTHVHINEPGRTEWEGFASATRAAAAGGITTLVEMPLNSIPPTTSVAALQEKVTAAAGKCWVDVGFWGGAVPENLGQLGPLLDAGCLGFKCFLVPSGVDEFPHLKKCDLRQAMSILAGLGAVLLVHAELPEHIHCSAGSTRRYEHYLHSRPKAAENSAIKLLAQLCAETGCKIHIVHLSSAEALPVLRAARAQGLPCTVETCPHYLVFSAEDIPDGATEFKCAPPIREAGNREELWQGLREGCIDMIASDHSPCSPALKQKTAGDFFGAWGGIASLQLALPVVWTEANRRGFTIMDIMRWMATNPARLAELTGRKGAIAPGYDADFIFWNPDEEFVVEAQSLHHRHTLTPYAGRRLKGVVKKTFVRGQPVTMDGQPPGCVLKRIGDRS